MNKLYKTILIGIFSATMAFGQRVVNYPDTRLIVSDIDITENITSITQRLDLVEIEIQNIEVGDLTTITQRLDLLEIEIENIEIGDLTNITNRLNDIEDDLVNFVKNNTETPLSFDDVTVGTLNLGGEERGSWYQPFSEYNHIDNLNITPSMGNTLFYIMSEDETLTFDDLFPPFGKSEVFIRLFTDGNTLTFDTNKVLNADSLVVSENYWNNLTFKKYFGEKWYGVNHVIDGDDLTLTGYINSINVSGEDFTDEEAQAMLNILLGNAL